jgi:acetylornithine aminotransferase/acetylornithine/N-succinyldiaminopimelate aminotransferase
MAKAAVGAMSEQGVIINRTHETSLRFLPPYTIGKKHIDQVVGTLDEILKQLEKTNFNPPAPSPAGELVAQGSTY